MTISLSGLALGFGAAFFAAGIAGAGPVEGTIALETRAHRIENFLPFSDRQVFGRLRFDEGFHITATDRLFGALSGFRLTPDGFVAVSDTGYFVRGRFRDGVPRDIELTPMRDTDGRPFRYKWASDAEALEIASDGSLLVAFEQNNRIVRYVDPFGAAAPAMPIPTPIPRRMNQNRGLEALALAPDGRLAVFAEGTRDADGNTIGFLLGERHSGRFAVANRADGFAVTDAAFDEAGVLYLLERRFNLGAGPGMRIRRIAADAVRDKVVVDGDTLIEVGLPHQIDNMEGLDVETVDGETTFTLVSDDNYSMLQRTLMLRFTLLP